MADLLECLLQIKGLRETLGRIVAVGNNLKGASAVDRHGAMTARRLLAQLGDVEARHGTWLRAMLAVDRPRLLDSTGPAADHDASGLPQPVDRFAAERSQNLDILDHCSASDLARTGVREDGHAMTVADLVAVMLAHDVDILGELRRALAL